MKNAFLLTVENGAQTILDRYAVQPSTYVRLSGFNLSEPTTLLIEDKTDPANYQAFAITEPRKTVFVTYEKEQLRSQSGTGIFSKETKSGLSLKNNVKNVVKANEEQILNILNKTRKDTPQQFIEFAEGVTSWAEKNDPKFYSAVAARLILGEAFKMIENAYGTLKK